MDPLHPHYTTNHFLETEELHHSELIEQGIASIEPAPVCIAWVDCRYRTQGWDPPPSGGSMLCAWLLLHQSWICLRNIAERRRGDMSGHIRK